MSIVIERSREPLPVSIDTINELVGHEPDSPNTAAERDVKDILSRMSEEFDAIVETLVRGAARL